MKIKRVKAIAVHFIAACLGFITVHVQVFAQSFDLQALKQEAAKRKQIFLTRAEILAGAKKEGKLKVVPGFTKDGIPIMVDAFKKKYPFIKDVTWDVVTGTVATQREVMALAAGSKRTDVLNVSSAVLDTYVDRHLMKAYDFVGMAQAGELKIPLKMIQGLMVWTGNSISIIAYSTGAVPPDKAPKNWNDCLDPRWKGKVAVDTRGRYLARVYPAWSEEQLLDFAKKLKDNDPKWVRGQTSTMPRLTSGELALFCGANLHSTSRVLITDPSAPIKITVPEPVGMTTGDHAAIYTKAENPHAGLLWIEFTASKEGQQVRDSFNPGDGSYLVEGTLANKLVGTAKVSVCADLECLSKQRRVGERIIVEAWKFPKAGK
jgi:iron(III) transport system substrate-binding protein